MSLPDKALFTTQEACEHLALSQSSVRRLIAEGQLVKVYPRPRAMRITRESLAAHLARASDQATVQEATATGQQAQAQARVTAQQEVKQEKKRGLLSRWGLGG